MWRGGTGMSRLLGDDAAPHLRPVQVFTINELSARQSSKKQTQVGFS